VDVEITKAKIVAFWDLEYAGYDGTGQGEGGWDMSQNCYGYAFRAALGLTLRTVLGSRSGEIISDGA
jgi:hypothetical protein